MKNETSRYWLGLIFVVIGIIFVFKNFDLPFFNEIDIFSFLIPILLLFWAFESYKKDKLVWSLILGLVGSSMLFDAFDVNFLGFSLLSKLLVPGIFILLGYLIINKHNKPQNNDSHHHYTQNEQSTYYSPGAEINQDSDSGPMNSDNSDTYTPPPHMRKNRQISCVFSSQRVFYAKSDFPAGNSTLDATCVFGDLDMIFSPDIHLHVVANVTMADLNFIGNKVGGIMNKYEETYSATNSDVHVYLSVSVVFGDVDIIHSR